MDDFASSLRQHYEAQHLPLDRAQAILALGRAAVARKKRRRRWLLAAAALVAMSLTVSLSFPGRVTRQAIVPLVAADMAAAVVDYFARPENGLPTVSADRAVLAQWLGSHGAPGRFSLPAGLATLESLGCQVLEVRGQRVSLVCLFLESSPAINEAASAKKSRPLVHVLVASRDAFREIPRPGEYVRLAPSGAWNFIAWSSNELIFVAASEAPPVRLAHAVGLL